MHIFLPSQEDHRSHQILHCMKSKSFLITDKYKDIAGEIKKNKYIKLYLQCQLKKYVQLKTKTL